jgi:hypothetical protein
MSKFAFPAEFSCFSSEVNYLRYQRLNFFDFDVGAMFLTKILRDSRIYGETPVYKVQGSRVHLSRNQIIATSFLLLGNRRRKPNMKTRQKKVFGSLAIIALVLLGILAGLALSHLLQVTEESTETTELVVSYPNALTVDIASQIYTAGSNDHFLNVSMVNNEPPSEFNLYVLMAFPGNISAGDITLSAESGIVLANWNPCPAFVAEQVNATAIEFMVPWYVPELSRLLLGGKALTVPQATLFTFEPRSASLLGTLMVGPSVCRFGWKTVTRLWVGIEPAPYVQTAIDVMDCIEPEDASRQSVSINGRLLYFYQLG